MIDTKNTMDTDSFPSHVKDEEPNWLLLSVVVETTSELRKLGPRVQHPSHIGFWKGRLTLVDLLTSYSIHLDPFPPNLAMLNNILSQGWGTGQKVIVNRAEPINGAIFLDGFDVQEIFLGPQIIGFNQPKMGD